MQNPFPLRKKKNKKPIKQTAKIKNKVAELVQLQNPEFDGEQKVRDCFRMPPFLNHFGVEATETIMKMSFTHPREFILPLVDLQ